MVQGTVCPESRMMIIGGGSLCICERLILQNVKIVNLKVASKTFHETLQAYEMPRPGTHGPTHNEQEGIQLHSVLLLLPGGYLMMSHRKYHHKV